MSKPNAQYNQKSTIERRGNVSVALHYLASLLLLSFALSHFAFLGVPDAAHGFQNTVFPFMSNRMVYITAGIFEGFAGIICWKLRGTGGADVLILTFVGVLIWYRWAFSYTGGSGCNCLGLLGRLLKVNKSQETVIPITVMITLVAATIPGVCRFLQSFVRAHFHSRTVSYALILPALSLQAEQTLEIRGTLEVANYNPHTGEVHSNTHARSTFVTILWGNGWKVSVTNFDRGGTWWAQRFYDGTNTYVLRPSSGNFWYTNFPRTDSNRVTISPSSAAISFDADPFGASLAALTYGISPEAFKKDRNGNIAMPIPWTVVHENLDAFGFRWDIQASDDGRFLKSFTVYRDKALDLPNKEELLRFELDYPETLKHYNAYMGQLLSRKAAPAYLRARYECVAWFRTNGMSIPKESRLDVYLPPSNGALPGRIFTLNATSIAFVEGRESILPPITANTGVRDYRYKRRNTDRIFKYAEYTLTAGDSWKPSEDPVLLAEADSWLKHGRKYTQFADRGKRWVTWLLLALLLAPAVIMWRKRETKQNKQIA